MIHRPFVTELQRDAAQIRLPGRLISPLHIRPGDALYTVVHRQDMAEHTKDEGLGALRPLTTVYASPFPFGAWGRLVKTRFTTGPGPGTTLSLCNMLGEADLYPRSIQTSEHHSLAASSRDKRGQVVVPDTEVVFEVPLKIFLDAPVLDDEFAHSRTHYKVAEANVELHERLHALLSNESRSDASQHQGNLSGCIKVTRRSAQGASVDSLMPTERH